MISPQEDAFIYLFIINLPQWKGIHKRQCLYKVSAYKTNIKKQLQNYMHYPQHKTKHNDKIQK